MLALWMAVTPGVFESRPRNFHGGMAGDDFEALHHARDHLVFQAGVEILGVLAKDRQVDGHIVKTGLQAGEHAHRPEVGVQPQLFPQSYVDAGVAAADGRGSRPFQADARHFERREDFVGQ